MILVTGRATGGAGKEETGTVRKETVETVEMVEMVEMVRGGRLTAVAVPAVVITIHVLIPPPDVLIQPSPPPRQR